MWWRLFLLLLHVIWYLPLLVFGQATVSDLVASAGVLYIKLAQMITTRPDLFPMGLIERLSTLRDQVPPSLKVAPCLASGSIAEVYDLGDRVVKLKRRQVDRYLEEDYQILLSGLQINRQLISWIWGPSMLEGLTRTLKLVRSTIPQHLDFPREAEMTRRIRELLKGRAIVPQVYRSGDDYISMEKMTGRPLEESPELLADFLRLVHDLIMTHRLVHGDLHEGNLLVQNGQIVLLDFGLVQEISSEQVTLLKIFLEALIRPSLQEIELMVGLMYQQDDGLEFKDQILALFQGPKESLYAVLCQLVTIFKQHQVDFEESLLTPLLSMVMAESISRKHRGPDFLSILRR